MGQRTGHTCSGLNETTHEVLLSRSMIIAETEVTQAQYKAVMKASPSLITTCGTNCPVENVTWAEAAAYCNALSGQAGIATCYSCSGAGKTTKCSLLPAFSGGELEACPGYRLPTDAEWEYAYRAGTTTPFYSGKITSCVSDANATTIGWYKTNASGVSKETQPVGKLKENVFGLHDMAGNVWEWAQDWYQADLGKAQTKDPSGPASGNSRVMRGGCWSCQASDLRGARRHSSPPASSNNTLGFRCLRSPDAALAAHWKLDTGAGTTALDSSGGGHPGQVWGASWTAGVMGKALSFNGASHRVLTTFKPVFAASDGYTLSAWVKTSTAAAQDLMGFETTMGSRLGLTIYSKGELGFEVRGTGGSLQKLTTSKSYSDGGWHHVAVSRQASPPLLTLYVDGAQAATATDKTVGSISLGVTPGFALGCRYRDTKAAGFLKGELDDARVYRRALSPEEVRRLYQQNTWARALAGSGVDAINAVARDSKGNLYITGTFTGSATLGSKSMTTTAGKAAMFVAALTPDGTVTWVDQATGSSTSEGTYIALDSAGDLYVYGGFKGTVTVGGTVLTSKGLGDVFLARYTTTGSFKAVLTYGGAAQDSAAGLVVPPQNTPMVAINFGKTILVGGTTYTCVGPRDSLVIKHTTSGTVSWATHFNGPGEDVIFSITATTSGTPWAVGYYTGKPTYGSSSLSSKSGSEDIFVAKLKSAGGINSATSAGGTGLDWGADVAVSGSKVYIAGAFEYTATFGSISRTSKVGWDAFVAELDQTALSFKWAEATTGTDTVDATSVKVSAAGQVFVTGSITGPGAFGSLRLAGMGSSDAYLAKLSSTGTWLWVQSAGSDMQDTARGLLLTDGDRSAVLVGTFQDKGLLGETPFTSKGSHDGYIWRQAVP